MKEFVDRLISRLEELKIRNNEIEGIDSQSRSKAYENAISIVNELVKEYNSGWIPCNERLPKNLEHIYITGSLKEKSLYEDILGETKSTDCFYGYYRNGKFYGYTEEGVFWLLDAKTWQPLSEPYKRPDGYWEEFQSLSSTWMHGSKHTTKERR